MKTRTMFFLLFIVALSCNKKSTPELNSDESFVRIGKIENIFSKDLNEERKFWIYLPYGVDKSPEPGKKYPVLYLLDGDSHFQSVTGLIQQLSTVNGNALLPEMIIVAIPNTDRTRDLTTSHVNDEEDSTSGGAENFTLFLKQLTKHIEANYPASSYRTLIGHSFGGLFVLNTLIYHRDMFTNYVAIDPSLWWDKQKLLKASKSAIDTSHFDKKSLYVAIAHTVKKGMTFKDLASDTTENSLHMRSIIEFCEFASRENQSGLDFKSKYYPDDGHGSVVLISEHDALRSIFSWHDLNGLDNFFGSDSHQTADDVLAYLKEHYKNVSDHLGYEVIPDRQMVSNLGYYFMEEKRSDRALAMFNLNLTNYPQLFSTYEAMGDYFLHEKDTSLALGNYRKALSISKEKEIVAKVEKLEK